MRKIIILSLFVGLLLGLLALLGKTYFSYEAAMENNQEQSESIETYKLINESCATTLEICQDAQKFKQELYDICEGALDVCIKSLEICVDRCPE